MANEAAAAAAAPNGPAPPPPCALPFETNSVPTAGRNPDGLLWRPMPQELIAPFQAQAARTSKVVSYGSLAATVLIKAFFALTTRA